MNPKTKKLKKPVTSINSKQWYDSPLQIALRAIGVAVGSVLVLFIAVMLVVPRLNNGQALTVMSGSMAPAINAGDVIVVRGLNPQEVCQEIQMGEIVTYFPHENDPTLITHRIVDKIAGHYPDGTNCRLVPKGDDNNTADEMISPEQVRGQLMYNIPKVGWVNDWVAKNQKQAAIGALGVIGLYYCLSGVKQPKSRVLYLGGNSNGAGPKPPQRKMGEEEYLAKMRELDLRERELRLDEIEAAEQFGYQPPEWA